METSNPTPKLEDYNVVVKGHVNLNTLEMEWVSEKYSKFYQCYLNKKTEKRIVKGEDGKEYTEGPAQMKGFPILIFENQKEFELISEELKNKRYERIEVFAILNENFTIKACHVEMNPGFEYKIMVRNQYSRELKPLTYTTYDNKGNPQKAEVISDKIKVTVVESNFSQLNNILKKLINKVKKWKK